MNLIKNAFAWLVLLSAAVFAMPAFAQNFTANSFSLLATTRAKPDAIFGYGSTNDDLQMFQYEHFSTHDWGDVYFDAELYHGSNVGAPFEKGNDFQNLFVLNPRASIGKLSGIPMKLGPVSDVSIIGRWEAGSYPSENRFRSENYGVSLNFDVPGFAWFESGALYRHTNFDHKTWLWRSVLLSKRLNVAGQNFSFNLLSLVNGSDHQGTEILERPDFLWDIAGNPKTQLGVRLEYAKYSNDPIKGGSYSRFTPFLVLKYTP